MDREDEKSRLLLAAAKQCVSKEEGVDSPEPVEGHVELAKRIPGTPKSSGGGTNETSKRDQSDIDKGKARNPLVGTVLKPHDATVRRDGPYVEFEWAHGKDGYVDDDEVANIFKIASRNFQEGRPVSILYPMPVSYATNMLAGGRSIPDIWYKALVLKLESLVLCPLNLNGNHWVLFAFTVSPRKEISALYWDPMGNPAPRNFWVAVIHTFGKSNCVDLACQVQFEVPKVHCGIFAAELGRLVISHYRQGAPSLCTFVVASPENRLNFDLKPHQEAEMLHNTEYITNLREGYRLKIDELSRVLPEGLVVQPSPVRKPNSDKESKRQRATVSTKGPVPSPESSPTEDECSTIDEALVNGESYEADSSNVVGPGQDADGPERESSRQRKARKKQAKNLIREWRAMSDLEKCLTLEGQVNVPGFSFESFYNRKGEFESSRAATALARAKLHDEGARGRLNRLFNFMAFWGTKKKMLASDTPMTPDLSRVAAVRGVRTKSGSKGSASEPATTEPPSMATSSGLSGEGTDAVRANDAGGPKEKVAPEPIKGVKLAGLPTLPGYDAPSGPFQLCGRS